MDIQEGSFLDPARVIAVAGIHEGMKVADFGSASGFFTRAAARAVGRLGTVWTVDHDRTLLERTKSLAEAEGLHNIELAAGNIEHRGGSLLPDEEMDCVIAANVLFSARDKNVLVEELWRTLKRGGRAVVIDWKDSFGGIGPHPTHVLTQAAARTLFESGGFAFVQTIPTGNYHWGFIMRKK